MEPLAERHCVPCRGGVPPLPPGEVSRMLSELEGWSDVDARRIEKEFAFRDFATALEFVNAIGAVAEEEGHHPDIHLGWGRVGVEIWTHKINGLTESDFILAAKIDRLAEGARGVERRRT